MTPVLSVEDLSVLVPEGLPATGKAREQALLKRILRLMVERQQLERRLRCVEEIMEMQRAQLGKAPLLNRFQVREQPVPRGKPARRVAFPPKVALPPGAAEDGHCHHPDCHRDLKRGQLYCGARCAMRHRWLVWHHRRAQEGR